MNNVLLVKVFHDSFEQIKVMINAGNTEYFNTVWFENGEVSPTAL